MIHFSHGNGFPAETYHQLIKGLKQQEGINVGYISCLGHNPSYPVVDDWSGMADEVIAYISKHYTDKVVAIGHSLGGVLSYWACMKRPDLFKSIILLDSPIFSNFKYALLEMTKALGLIEYFTPARHTRNRRFIWPSHEAAIKHFAGKKVFKYFDERCLRDYVYFGTDVIKDPTGKHIGVSLRFDPMIEWKIYRTISSFKISKLPENVPCGLIYGEYSKTVSDKDAKYMANKHNIWVHKLANCGHLFPFEKPTETVSAILKFAAENNIKL
jgi:pimeloyl-ACP methyl ester carboxylesterase